MIKKIFLLSALLFVITSCGENYSSKKCLGNNYEKWTNCTSEYTWKNGTNYIGEWMNGKTLVTERWCGITGRCLYR